MNYQAFTGHTATPQRIEVRNRKGQFQWLTIDLGEESIQYAAKSQNVKTGPIPTQWIGATREESEDTCRVCPLWARNVCYSQDGSPRLGHSALLKKVRQGVDRGIDQAITNAHEDAEFVRFGSIGDPGSIRPEVYDAHEKRFREEGMGVISYTHHWFLPHATFLKGKALASADNMQDVVDAVDAGWRVAVHVDAHDAVFNGKTIQEVHQGTISRLPVQGEGGRYESRSIKYFLCPAQRTNNKTTCNDCGLCDATKPMKYNVIVFVEHGLQMGFEKLREERKITKGIPEVELMVDKIAFDYTGPVFDDDDWIAEEDDGETLTVESPIETLSYSW